MGNVLNNLQAAVVQRLNLRLNIPGVSVVALNAADLVGVADAAAKSSGGLSLVVLEPVPERTAADVAGPVYLQVSLTVRATENLLINKTGCGLLELTERATRVLHLWPLPAACGEGVLQVADAARSAIGGPERGAISVDLHLVALGTLTRAAVLAS